jgi:hypothetical protein
MRLEHRSVCRPEGIWAGMQSTSLLEVVYAVVAPIN